VSVEPELVIRSGRSETPLRLAKVAMVVTVLVGVLSAILIYNHALPGSQLLGGAACVAIAVASFPVAVLVGFLFWNHFRLRGAHVTFLAGRVSFVWGPDPADSMSIAWSDLAGYDDSSSDFIELCPARSAPRYLPRLAVPTLTESDRTRVCALLDAKGLKRLT
jgi:hypothetical protein